MTLTTRARLSRVAAIALLPLTLYGCDAIFGGDEAEPARSPGGMNAECANDNQCRTGLACIQRACVPAGNTPENGPCTLTAECGDGLYCQAVPSPAGLVGLCQSAGDGQEGDGCSLDADCEQGLRCELFGFSGTCAAAGEGDFSAPCAEASECMAGLICSGEGFCAQSVFPAGVVFFEGAECPGDTLEGGFQALFEVPRSGQTVTEFYSLPFPNNIRLENGRVDLSGHPRPPLDVVGNIVKTVIELIEAEVDGYSPFQATFFRFNTFPQSESLTVGGDNPTVYLVDIDDPESDSFGRHLSLGFTAASNQGNFICRNWLAVRPPWNQPYRQGSTYAAVITTGVRGPNGEAPAQSADLQALLGDERPSDADLAAAWDEYEPFRVYLEDQAIDADTIAAAAVYTIGNPTDPMSALRAHVEGNYSPSVDDLVLCDDGVTSPCDDGLEGEDHVRGCFTASNDFYEIHTRIEVPIYQEGDAPYLETGGGILFNDSGAPIRQRTEDVCAAITIPKGQEMPDEGWPVVVYVHGTGGSLRSHINSYAGDLSAIGYATIGFDGVQHGERRGDSDLDPDALFFNYVNPRGVLGSIQQGAVDVMAVGRYAAAVDVAQGDSPTGDALLFNPALVTLFGHSQGGIVGVPAVAVDDTFAAVVFSGAGGGLTLSLLNKTSPVNISGGVEALLGDGALSDMHPFLNLMQLYFEPVESLNFGRSTVLFRPEEMAPPHLLMTWGQGDTYTPNATTVELAHAIGLSLVTPVVQPFGRPEVPPPVTGNVFVDTFDVTAALVQYCPFEDCNIACDDENPCTGARVCEAGVCILPDAPDGHFVVFDVAAARTQVLGFLETLVTEGIPTIPAP